MPKKKHRKKARSAERAPHKAAKHTMHVGHIKRVKHSKRTKHHGAHAKPGHSSLPLLRAIKRRRAAQNGEHREFDGMHGDAHHSHKKRGKAHRAHKVPLHHGEPVITEKSFENMLAYRRFKDHAR